MAAFEGLPALQLVLGCDAICRGWDQVCFWVRECLAKKLLQLIYWSVGFICVCQLGTVWASEPAQTRVFEVTPEARLEVVPPALRPWVPWVLAEEKENRCPFDYANAKRRRCLWPGTLHFSPQRLSQQQTQQQTQQQVQQNAQSHGKNSVEALGAQDELVAIHFSQKWRAYADGWVYLPGGDIPRSERNWPSAVRINGESVVVVRQADRPAVWVTAGDYVVEGQVTLRATQPYLWIPVETGLVQWQLSAEGAMEKRDFHAALSAVFEQSPRVDTEGRLWLTPPRQQGAREENVLTYQLFRRFEDGVPVMVQTQMILAVGGQEREIKLPDMLLPGLTLVSTRAALPYRWEDRDLFVRVKPGQWPIEFRGRFIDPVSTVQVPQRTTTTNTALNNASTSHTANMQTQSAQGIQPTQVLWVLATNPKFRALNTSGLLALDPTQTALPEAWQGDSVFLAEPGAQWQWNVSPVPTSAGQNALKLVRTLWLDFYGQGVTVQDRIEGRVVDQWRLSAHQPLQLGRVTINASPAVITTLPKEELTESMVQDESSQGGAVHPGVESVQAENQNQGVELRSGQLNLEAIGRFVDRQSVLPVTGWDTNFTDVTWQLNLPPAWRVFAVQGADQVRGTWWSHWRIWDVFWVALLVAATYRLTNWAFAALTAVLLVLTYAAELSVSPFVWALTIGVLALARSGIEVAWVKRVVGVSAALMSVLWVLLLAPLLFGELKRFVFPEVFDDIQWAQTQLDGAPPTAVRANAMPAPNMLQAQGMRGDDYEAVASTAAPAMASTSSLPPRELRRKSYAASKRGNLASKQIVPARVQTGPGAPSWARDRGQVTLRWKGPVRADQQVRLYWASPLFLRGLSMVKLVLWPMVFLGFIYWFWQSNPLVFSFVKNLPLPGYLKRVPVSQASSLVVVMLSGLCVIGGVTPNVTWASVRAPTDVQFSDAQSVVPTSSRSEAFPNAELLSALQKYLTQPPQCAPGCFSVSSLRVDLSGDHMALVLQIHVQAPVFLPLPVAPAHWVPNRITTNGKETFAISVAKEVRPGGRAQQQVHNSRYREPQILLSAGQHTVRLEGMMLAAQELQLNFPWSVNNVDISAPGWKVYGLKGGFLLNNALILKRESQLKDEQKHALWVPKPAPTFVRLHRHFDFDHQLSVTNTLERVAPDQAAITLTIPLLPGETVLNEGLSVGVDGIALNLAAGQNQYTWQSQLVLPGIDGAKDGAQLSGGGKATAAQLRLQAQSDPSIVERWQFSMSTQWHVQFRGLSALPTGGDANPGELWQPMFWPWSGETVEVFGRKPDAVPGYNLTVDRAIYSVSPGLRATNASIDASVYNSVASPFDLELPNGAYDVSLTINGRAFPVPELVDQSNAPVKLAPLLQPGKQQVQVKFQVPNGIAAHYQVPVIALPRPLVNFETKINLPSDRWVLWLSGQGQGPRVTFWVAFVLVLLIAPWIGKKSWIPVRGYEWVLLGLGFSLSFWPGLVGLLLWLIVLQAKPLWSAFIRSPRIYNLAQVVLVALSLWVLVSFVVAVPTSLLANPRMAVTGQYWSGAFVWYQDRLAVGAGVKDEAYAAVLSLPLWVYRVAMMLWCLWLANRMVQWARWGWGRLALGGWLKRPIKKDKESIQPKAVESEG